MTQIIVSDLLVELLLDPLVGVGVGVDEVGDGVQHLEWRT